MANREIEVGDVVRSEHGHYGLVMEKEHCKGTIGLDRGYDELIVQYTDGRKQRCNPLLTTRVGYSNTRDSEIRRVLSEVRENLPGMGTIGRAELVDRLMSLRELVLDKKD